MTPISSEPGAPAGGPLIVRNRVFPMFVGCGRSGTTLVRNIFDAHPQLAVTHEAHFIAPMAQRRHRYQVDGAFDVDGFVRDLFEDANLRRQGMSKPDVATALRGAKPESFPDAVRLVFALYARGHGKPLYGDKTPGSVNHIRLLGSLFPEMKFVHIIRDGRAVALSYLERPEWGPKTVGAAANHWLSRVAKGRAAGETVGLDRYREVRYEDVVESPGPTTAEICQFLGLEYVEDMLRYHESGEEFIATTKDPAAFRNLAQPVTRGLRDWRLEMSRNDVNLFEAIAGDLLADLGYEVGEDGPTIRSRLGALGAGISWQGKRVAARLPLPSRSPGKAS